MSRIELDSTHDPAVSSWLERSGTDNGGDADFPVQNLPFGIFDPGPAGSGGASDPRGGVRIGSKILDLRAAAGSGLLTGAAQAGAAAAAGATLNRFFGLGPTPRQALRAQLHRLLTDEERRPEVEALLVEADSVRMRLPAAVGDYTDFYAGIHHAVTVGALFRPDDPLLPNYKWIPIGYHGRASSVLVSGEAFHRPRGQRKPAPQTIPEYGPCRSLDFELELGIWIGGGNELGHPVPMSQAAQQVAGYCLLNDWSARDVQAWEYQPLGPFLAKNFATTVSAWVVTPEALIPFRIGAPARDPGDPQPLPHLFDEDDRQTGGLDVALEVLLRTAAMREKGDAPQRISASSSRHLYWTVAQLIAHHTSGGCDLRPGDLLGSGTISAPSTISAPGTASAAGPGLISASGVRGYGSLMEMTGNGAHDLTLPSGESRTFLQDGDEVLLRARATRPGMVSIGFGECRATVLPQIH